MPLGQPGQEDVAAAPNVNTAGFRNLLPARCWECRLKDFGWPKTSHLLYLPIAKVSAASPPVILLGFIMADLRHRGEKWWHIARLPFLTAEITTSPPGHPCSRLRLRLTQLSLPSRL